MIYNRTQTDVDNAINLRETKVKNFEELTAEEVEILERGTLTIHTLNRIEDKQAELQQILNDMGYWNTNITNRNWTYNDIFDITNFQRIINNLNVLRNAFFVYADTPPTPLPEYHFENLNSIEKILYDLEKMINEVKSNYHECGNVECGEDELI